ncbi:hypothetical protein LIER_00729 [Lithospermum erythrorhizon]|uniref:PAR1 protein n=1 Tax=Lithospermum erythrorhizon TaxID=34254 RepID=A0AAV3NKW6_LITER
MASSSMKSSLIVFFVCSIAFHGTLGEIICEDLPNNVCSFSIASSGKRCVLENYENKEGNIDYQCRTSEVVVERMAEHIETEECINACGVDRNCVGISSDALLDAQTTSKLCSSACYEKCPNIVDLYFNLAAGEGVYLPDLCNRVKTNPHRAMLELLSNSDASVHSEDDAAAPA